MCGVCLPEILGCFENYIALTGFGIYYSVHNHMLSTVKVIFSFFMLSFIHKT